MVLCALYDVPRTLYDNLMVPCTLYDVPRTHHDHLMAIKPFEKWWVFHVMFENIARRLVLLRLAF